MDEEEDDDFDPITEADEILAEDRDAYLSLTHQAHQEKNPRLYLQAAIKATKLADLYYEALEESSPRFIEYKIAAAEYYLKVADELKMDHAKIMAGMMYLQAGEHKKAEKIYNTVLNRVSRMKANEEEKEMYPIFELLLEKPTPVIEKQITNAIKNLDKDIKAEILLTYKYLSEAAKKS
jgi:hypothetical protein